MEAMVLKEPRSIETNPLELKEMSEPEPGPGQIKMRVHACGICHTDLHTAEGELMAPSYPLILGHQIVGEIAALGQGASRFKKEERVGVPWLHFTCGECQYCRRGEENLCEKAKFTGFDVHGGYAQYALAYEDFAYRIPEGFPDPEAAPLLCAGVIGYRALRLSEVRPGERLGLYGFGASAHIVLQVALHWGCEVFVFSRGQEH